jgi:hypothetical protein
MGVVQPEVIPSSSEQTLPIVAADLQVQQGSNTHELVNESTTETSTPQATTSERRYPERVRKPPVRLDLRSSGVRTVVRVRTYIQYIDIQQKLLFMTLMLMLGAAKTGY